jgi:hypothetical protein
MIAVSYAMTSDAFADGSKSETRRFWKPAHAAKFQPGREFMGWSKDPRAGGQRLHAARVVFCRPERLGDMSEDSFQREGGTRYWPDRAAYIAAMGGPDLVPYVLRFEHVWDADPPVVRDTDVPPRAKAARISVRDQGWTYVARFRGKTASCTWSPKQAARAVAAKVLGRLMVPIRCVVENRLYEISEG